MKEYSIEKTPQKKDANKLGYSDLTDRVYFIDAKGEKHDVTQNFIQVMLLWHYRTDNSFIEVGQPSIRTLDVDGVPHWELTAIKLK